MSHTWCEHCKSRPATPAWDVEWDQRLPLYRGNTRLWLCEECYVLLEDGYEITRGYEQ